MRLRISGCNTVQSIQPTSPPSPTHTTVVEPEWTTYVNDEGEFSLSYPSSWALREGRDYIALSRGTVDLIIGYHRPGEEANICCRRELPEGEVIETGTLTSAGQEISRAVLKRDDKIKMTISTAQMRQQQVGYDFQARSDTRISGTK